MKNEHKRAKPDLLYSIVKSKPLLYKTIEANKEAHEILEFLEKKAQISPKENTCYEVYCVLDDFGNICEAGIVNVFSNYYAEHNAVRIVKLLERPAKQIISEWEVINSFLISIHQEERATLII